jgi:hypothetical protein
MVSTSLVGSKTLPISFFGVGKTIEFVVSGLLTLAGSETTTFRVEIGGTTLTIAVTLDHNDLISSQFFEFRTKVTCKAISGTNSTYIYSSSISCQHNTNGGNILYGTSADSGTLAINTGATIATDIRAFFSASNAANSVVINNCTSEYLN